MGSAAGPVSLERQVLFWVAGVAALFFALYVLGSTVTPFAAGIALGYLLDPVVRKLERLGLNRLGRVPAHFDRICAVRRDDTRPRGDGLEQPVGIVSQHLPEYAKRLEALAVDEYNAIVAKYGGRWLDAFGLPEQLSSAQIQKSVGDFVAQSAQWLLDSARSVVWGSAAVFNFLSLLIITPVVAFYILLDWNRMVCEINSSAAARLSRQLATNGQR